MVIHVFMSSWVTKTKVVLATDAMTASLDVMVGVGNLRLGLFLILSLILPFVTSTNY